MRKSKAKTEVIQQIRIIHPPINVNNDGRSPANKKAQMGPKTDSDNIITPTIAEGVLRAPWL